MIKKIKYQDLDLDQYIRCLDTSDQKKSYAYPHYLDVVCGNNWDVLVYNDYEAVMPVPFVIKLGVKFVIMPKLTQQLGVYSMEDKTEINDLFLSFLQKEYAIWYYAFNDVNRFSQALKSRKNFLIHQGDYELIRQKYSPKRKRKLRLDPDVLQDSERKLVTDFSQIDVFMRDNYAGVEGKDLDGFIKIFKAFFDDNYLKVYGFKYQNQWVNMIALYEDDLNAILLGTFNKKEFVKLSGACVLIDDAIRDNVAMRIFDFEGSELSNVEEFFRGFRPELKPYHCIDNTRKQAVVQALKKFFLP